MNFNSEPDSFSLIWSADGQEMRHSDEHIHMQKLVFTENLHDKRHCSVNIIELSVNQNHRTRFNPIEWARFGIEL